LSEENMVVKKSQKFGWCFTDEHESCRIRFGYYEFDYQCACACHEKKDLPPLVRGKNHSPVNPKVDPAASKTRRKKSPPKT